jgi:hypothetical protein
MLSHALKMDFSINTCTSSWKANYQITKKSCLQHAPSLGKQSVDRMTLEDKNLHLPNIR